MKKSNRIFAFFMIAFFCVLPIIVSAQEISLLDDISLTCALELEPIESESINCESIFKSDGEYNSLYYALQDGFKIMKFAAPILVIILSTIDYVKAITSHDAEGLKKANGKFVKRLIIGILIFLLPFLLDFLFETFGIYDLETCGIGQ